MQRRDINFLSPSSKRPSGPGPSSRIAIVCGVIAILLIGGIIWGVKALVTSSFSHSSQTVLSEKKFSILTAVKNFFSKHEPVLDGEDEKEDRINILLLGMGGPGHDGPYLTDTIILASIKPSTKEVALISIPRDLQVKSEFGYTKINAVHANYENKYKGEGTEYTRQWFEKQFDIKIPYYIRVDFKAFVEAINAVGGVTIDVPKTFTDRSYPGPNYSYQTIHFDAGTQTMDGERALIFARSRHGVGDSEDYGRSKRQQLVMVALKDKLLSLGTLANPFKLQQLSNSLKSNVQTNLDWDQMLRLADLAQHVNRDSIKNLVLEEPKLGFLANANNQLGAVVVPVKGSFEDINQAIKYIFEPSANTFLRPVSTSSTISETAAISSPSLKTIKIEIQNGTWQAGLAAQIKKDLETKGFTVPTIATSVQRPIATTMIYIVNPQITPEHITSLSETLKAPVSSDLPSWLKTSTSTNYQVSNDVLIIIGSNYKTN